jgi:hypothetical protein
MYRYWNEDDGMEYEVNHYGDEYPVNHPDPFDVDEVVMTFEAWLSDLSDGNAVDPAHIRWATLDDWLAYAGLLEEEDRLANSEYEGIHGDWDE